MQTRKRLACAAVLTLSSCTLFGCTDGNDPTSQETNLAKGDLPKGVSAEPAKVQYKSLSKGHSAPALGPDGRPLGQ